MLSRLTKLANISARLRSASLLKESSLLGAAGSVCKGAWNLGSSAAQGVMGQAIKNPIRTTVTGATVTSAPKMFSENRRMNQAGFDPAAHNATLGVTPGAGANQ